MSQDAYLQLTRRAHNFHLVQIITFQKHNQPRFSSLLDIPNQKSLYFKSKVKNISFFTVSQLLHKTFSFTFEVFIFYTSPRFL